MPTFYPEGNTNQPNDTECRILQKILGALTGSGSPAASITATTDPVSGALTDGSGTITLGGTAQEVFAANATRSYLAIQNLSTENLWVNFGIAAVASQPSLKLIPNASFAMESSFVSNQSVSIIGATTSSAFAAKQG